jgi:malate dehydrogenase
MNTRVAIVGAGAVGASCAYALALNGSCSEIILYDIIPDIAIGKAIDISQSTLYSKRKTNIRAITEPSEMEDCDIVVITAGVPRKKDMTRADLLKINAGIVKEVALNIKKYSPNAIIISVSNPLDVMNYVVYRVTGWDRSRVIGMSGALDRARMAYEIYKKVGFGATQINAMVIGEHGEHMIPYPQLSNVDGINLTSMLSPEEIEEVVENTKSGGAQIVKYLKTSAYYAPGRAIAIMVEAILENRDIVVPSSVILEGEYGYEDISIGVPIVLGNSGAKVIIDMGLDENIKAKFDLAVKSIKDNIAILERENFFD